MWWIFKKKERDKWHKLHEKLDTSFSNIKTDILNVQKWIKHLNDHKEKHVNKLDKLTERIEFIEEFIKKSEKLGPKKLERSNFERVQTFKRSVQTFMNVQTVEKLTPAQKNVLLLLLYAGGPVGYEDIAAKLNVSTVTAKRHLLDLMRSGIDVQEKVSVKNRRKVFYLNKNAKKIILKRK